MIVFSLLHLHGAHTAWMAVVSRLAYANRGCEALLEISMAPDSIRLNALSCQFGISTSSLSHRDYSSGLPGRMHSSGGALFVSGP